MKLNVTTVVTHGITASDLAKQADEWWHRLHAARPITGKDRERLKNFMYLVKQELRNKGGAHGGKTER